LGYPEPPVRTAQLWALGVAGGVVGRRIDPLVAVADMRAAGVEPVVPYPGSNVPWACRCLTCGELVTPRLDSVRGGQGGCRRCGQRRRRVRPFLSHEQAEAQLRAAGMEPLVPYPGTTRAPWAGRCLTCGRLGAPRLDSIRRGARACQRCAARAAAPNRTPADVAVAAMRAAGLEPVEPWPGTVRTPWACRCLTCGAQVTPRLSAIRAGNPGCRACAAQSAE
jgi:hypothetical protein